MFGCYQQIARKQGFLVEALYVSYQLEQFLVSFTWKTCLHWLYFYFMIS